jgi:hypothetical protein
VLVALDGGVGGSGRQVDIGSQGLGPRRERCPVLASGARERLVERGAGRLELVAQEVRAAQHGEREGHLRAVARVGA